MTGNTQIRSKASAVFFAFVMVTSMVAVGFAGSAAAETSGTSFDDPADGTVAPDGSVTVSTSLGSTTDGNGQATFVIEDSDGATSDSVTVDDNGESDTDGADGEITTALDLSTLFSETTPSGGTATVHVTEGSSVDASNSDDSVEFTIDTVQLTATADPVGAGATATHTVDLDIKPNSDTISNSFDDITVEYGGNTDPSNVGQNSIEAAYIVDSSNGDTEEPIDIGSVSYNNDILTIDGSAGIGLGAGDTIHVEYADVQNGDEGDEDVTVSVNSQSEAESDTSSINYGAAEPDLDVTQIEDDTTAQAEEVTYGDDLTLNATVENTGNIEDSGTLEFRIANETGADDLTTAAENQTVSTQSVELDGGDSQEYTFTLDSEDVPKGADVYDYGFFLTGVSEDDPDVVSGSPFTNGEAGTNNALDSENNGRNLTVKYGVELSPNSTIIGSTETVSGTVTGLEDGESVSHDVYAPEDAGEASIASGSTSSGSFSVTETFNAQGDYTFRITSNDGPETDASFAATYDSSITFDPAEPAIGDTLTVSGQLLNSDGDGVDGETVNLRNPADSTDVGSTDTASNGEFSFTTTVNDAGTYSLQNNDQEIDSVAVSPEDANVTVTVTDGSSIGAFESTYLIGAKQTDDSELPFDESDATNYVNVTGPFEDVSSISGSVDAYVLTDGTEVAPTETAVADQSDTIAYIHVTPDTDEVELVTTPSTDSSTIGAELDNSGSADYAGVEGAANNDLDSPSEPDYVGSDSADVGSAQGLNANVNNADDLDVKNNGNALDVTVLGSDSSFPDGPGTNALANATVNVSGPGVDAGAFYDTEISTSGDGSVDISEGDTFAFSGLDFEEAGTATVEVSAYNDSGTEFTYSESFDVGGDNLQNVTPTDIEIQSNEDVTVEVTNSEGTAVNNRVVALSNVTFGVNTTSSGVQERDRVVIDGSDGVIYADSNGTDDYSDDVTVDDSIVVNNGAYTAENVSFESTGSVDVDVYRPDDLNLESATKTIDTTPISVSGVEAYEVESDVDPTLAGGSDQLNLTVTEDGDEVNGSLLDTISNNVDVTQNDTGIIQTGASTADLDDDGTDDTIQVTISAENADEQVDIEVEDDSSRTGDTTIDVVAPDVTASVNDREGDNLTEGLNATVDYTVEDPRDGSDGSAFDGGTVTVEAVNATFEVDEDQDGTAEDVISDGGTADITLDADGQQTVAIGVQELDDDADSPELLHSAQTEAASTGAGDVALPVESPSIYLFENGDRSDVPDTVAPNSEVDYTFEVTDANDRNIPVDGVDFTVDGASFDEETQQLDEGFADVTGEVTSGTITLAIDDLAEGDAVTLDQIDALEQAELDLTADAETVEQNGTVEFTLERLDRNRQTVGQLTITDADDTVVAENLEIDGTETVEFDADTYEAGDYTVEATKTSSSQRSFTSDTVNVTVEEPAGPEGYAITNVSLDPSTVEPNTTVDHDLSYTVTNASNDGDEDTYTVTLPSAASFEDENSLNVTDANGDEISISSSASFADADDGSNNQLTFGIQPDSAFDTSEVTVDANVTVNFDNVSETTTAPVTLDVSDSTQGDTSAQTDVTIQPADADPVAEYRNDQGEVEITGLRSAIDDFTAGNIEIGTLRTVIDEFTA